MRKFGFSFGIVRCRFVHVIIFLVIALIGLQLLHFSLLGRLDERSRKDESSENKNNDRDPRNNDWLSQSEVDKIYQSLLDTLDNTKRMDSSGEFAITKDLIKSNNRREKKSSTLKSASSENVTVVTLVSQCSPNHLYRVLDLTAAWRGPISISVFASGKHVSVAIDIILRLFQCYPFIFDQVSLHLVFQLSNILYKMAVPNYRDSEKFCENLQETLERQKTVVDNYAWSGVNYPSNLLRNVGIEGSDTDYVFVVDIDMIPSYGLDRDFSNFIRKSLTSYAANAVFVVPAFEIKNSFKVLPQDKDDLVSLWESNAARPFYKEVCWKCQRPTDYSAWHNLSLTENLQVGYQAVWKDPWEPFYIMPRTAPNYDERFQQYGFNRISQSCELYIAGYQFLVLNNAFLLHIGFKSRHGFHPNKDFEQDQNRIRFREFKEELKEKYPKISRRCY